MKRVMNKLDPKFKVIWEQVFPEDAELRIQRAFEMLLGNGVISKDQLLTTLDKASSGIDNESNERKVNEITYPPRSGRDITSISTVSLAVLEGKKAQRN